MQWHTSREQLHLFHYWYAYVHVVGSGHVGVPAHHAVSGYPVQPGYPTPHGRARYHDMHHSHVYLQYTLGVVVLLMVSAAPLVLAVTMMACH